jgi:hypothetical protein
MDGPHMPFHNPSNGPTLLAKSPGYMAVHTAAGNQVGIVSRNQRKEAERFRIAQPWAHIARTAVAPS